MPILLLCHRHDVPQWPWLGYPFEKEENLLLILTCKNSLCTSVLETSFNQKKEKEKLGEENNDKK